jgi:hypothetical protein
MSEAASGHPSRIDQFFAGPGARGDEWRNLVELAEAWSSGSGSRAEFEAALAKMTATEESTLILGFSYSPRCATTLQKTTRGRLHPLLAGSPAPY